MAAFGLYLAYMASWFLHLPERFPLLGPLRIDLVLAVLIAVLIALGGQAGTSAVTSRTNRLILALIGYVIATLPVVQWPGSVVRYGTQELVQAVVFYYFTVRLVTTERKLMRLLTVFVICQAFRVVEPLYLHMVHGYWGSGALMGNSEMLYRLSGAPSDVINPNGLAFVILTVIPFAHYLWTTSTFGAFLYVSLLPFLLYALVLTGSRSGIVGLAITFTVIWVHSQRKVLLGMVAVVAVAISVPALSADLRDRYESIFSASARNAATARGRVEGIKSDLAVAMRRPLFGHGLGTTREANANFAGNAQPSHNLFAQVLQELGFVGALLFAALLTSIVASVRRTTRALRGSTTTTPVLLRLGKAVQVWFAMNLLFSLFTYGLSNYSWYFMAGIADSMASLVRRPGGVDAEVRRRSFDRVRTAAPVPAKSLAHRTRRAAAAGMPLEAGSR